MQWAVHAGLDVIATYGSEIGRELLVAQGAGRVVSHTEASHVATLVEDGVSVDVVIEMLADVNLEDDLNLLRMGGRVVVVGSRGTIEITPRKLMSRAADIRGMSLANADETELREIYDAIDSGIRAGALAPAIQRTYPLARAAEAHHEVIENRSHGKIVLIP